MTSCHTDVSYSCPSITVSPHFMCDSLCVTFCLAAGAKVASLLPFFNFGVFASSLVFMLIYIWSRNFPTSSVSLMGLVTIEVRSLGSHTPIKSYRDPLTFW